MKNVVSLASGDIHDAAQVTYYGLHSLATPWTRRNRNSCNRRRSGKRVKGEGLVTEVFTSEAMKELKAERLRLAMFVIQRQVAVDMKMFSHSLFHFQTGSLALAHNGNLVNAHQLKSQLEGQGSIFQTTSDTEVLAHLIRRGRPYSI